MDEILTKTTNKLNKQAKKLDKVVKENNAMQDEQLALNFARKELCKIMIDLIHLQVKGESEIGVLGDTIWTETEKELNKLRGILIDIKIRINKNFKYVDKEDLKNTFKNIDSVLNHIENLVNKGRD